MKKQISIFSTIAFLIFTFSTQAQQKLLSIDDIYDPQKRVSFSGRPAVVQWAAGGANFFQAKLDNGNVRFLRVDAKTAAETSFGDATEIAAALAKTGLSAEEAQKAVGGFGSILNKSQTAALLSNGTDIFLFDLNAKSAKRLTNDAPEEFEADFSPDGKYASFVRGNNLFVVEVATGKETQLTRDGSENFLNGRLDWVYEEELYGRGNKRGYWWSPDSTAIAFLRFDETPVPKFAVVNHVPRGQEVEDTPYPKAGDPNPIVKLGVAEVKSGTIGFVDTSKYKPEDFLISRVTWLPNSEAVVYQAQNREQTFLDLNGADRKTYKTRTILRETSPAWVEVIDNPTFLKNGNTIWQSAARTGWKHLYIIDGTGESVKPLTSGDWEVRDFYGVDERTGFAYFSGTKESHIAPQIYRVKLDGTGLQRLTQGDGSHSAQFNDSFTNFVDTYSDIKTPPQTRLYKSDGTLERVISENKVEALTQYKLGIPEFLKVKTRDGKFEMEALMIRPPDFDATKKYPVMQFTYSGPHAPQVRNAWLGATEMWYHLLAQKGYIVWVMDNRTASGKGVQSEYGVYKNFGASELQDLEDGVNYLKTLPYVDATRIGLHGWSFGGFMTSYAMTHSNLYKMGIAGGSVTDWSLYDSIYTERYMKQPQNNPEGYKTASVIAAAPNLNGKLMLIHGVIDDNVHMQNTLLLAYELQKAGKQFDLMLYPTQRHGVTNPLQVKHMRQLMTDYILANL